MLKNLRVSIQKFWCSLSGATAIEYGLIAAGIAVAMVATAGLLGDQLAALFNQIANAVSGG